MRTPHYIDYGDEGFTPTAPRSKKPAKRGTPERTVQIAIKRYLEVAVPGIMIAWVRNELEFWRGTDEAKWRYIAGLKAAGLRTGFPDLILIWPGGGVGFMEIKVPGGSLHGEQPECHASLRKLGALIETVHSVDEARACLIKWNVKHRDTHRG